VELTNGVVLTDIKYLWHGSKICEVRDFTGANVIRRLFQRGEVLVGSPNTNYYYTKDHLGSIREAVDANGALQARYDYDAYGNKSVIQENLKTTLGFTGDFAHQTSGLYLTWFRALDATSARWLSRDPLGESQGRNLYSYVANNPMGYVDTYGLCPNDNNKPASSPPDLCLLAGICPPAKSPTLTPPSGPQFGDPKNNPDNWTPGVDPEIREDFFCRNYPQLCTQVGGNQPESPHTHDGEEPSDPTAPPRDTYPGSTRGRGYGGPIRGPIPGQRQPVERDL